jgi:membrane-associated protein
MELFTSFALFGLNPESIAQAGLWLIALIVFTESGLLVGFFLPGDTLLFAAGILASQGGLNIYVTITVIAIAAIVGDNVGYTIGKYSGPRLFKKEDGILFKHEYVERADAFYKKHGGKAVVLARFIPIVRTFAPLVAGIGRMDRRLFFFYNVFGALLWSISVTTLGYLVGQRFPQLINYLEYVIIGVVLLSFAPAALHIARDPRSRTLLKQRTKRLFTKSVK